MEELPIGWNNLDVIPPDEIVDVIDCDGNIANGQPTYYPFEIIKKEGDEKKAWGWRGTPVFYGNGISKWDGGWGVYQNLISINGFKKVIGWRLKPKQ